MVVVEVRLLLHLDFNLDISNLNICYETISTFLQSRADYYNFYGLNNVIKV